MSKIPSRITEYINDIRNHNIQPCGMINNNTNPSFMLKEDGLMTFNINFTPIPVCICNKYNISKNELQLPICYHILYILIYYYRVNMLTIRMYHKLSKDFYVSLISYMDIWINSQYDKKELKIRRKKNYDFTKETINLQETIENINILNPMLIHYTQDECAICMEPLCTQELIICPDCHNYSHIKCYRKWSIKKKGCHLCRNNPSKYQTDTEYPELF